MVVLFSGYAPAFCRLPLCSVMQECNYGSTSTSSCSERGECLTARLLLPLPCVVLVLVRGAAPGSWVVLFVSLRRNRPAHCAADVVKGRPLQKKIIGFGV